MVFSWQSKPGIIVSCTYCTYCCAPRGLQLTALTPRSNGGTLIDAQLHRRDLSCIAKRQQGSNVRVNQRNMPHVGQIK